MTARVYIHVGPYKTGTTFIQQVLDANRDRLAARGVCVPAHSTEGHARAALDALGQKLHGERAKARGQWQVVVADVQTWTGPAAVVSAELLSRAEPRDIERMVSSLRPVEVHVVYTARDVSKVVPAMWQTLMRNEADITWASYLASVRGDEDAERGFGERFWRLQDPSNVLPLWEAHLPRERIHVVTVPPSGADPSLLWGRFCSVLGLDPSPFSLKVRRANESLGTAESEVLRRVNARVASRVRPVTYGRWVKQFVARGVLERRADQRKFALPEQEHAWLRPRAEAIRAFLVQQDYDVVGDLDDLVPAAPKASAVAPDAVDTEEALDAAVDVIAGLLRRIDRSDRQPGAGPGSRDALVSALRRTRRRVGPPARRLAQRARRGRARSA